MKSVFILDRLHLVRDHAGASITEALTSDHHFEQAGFVALLK